MKQIIICDDDLTFANLLATEVKIHFEGQCNVSIFQSAEALRNANFSTAPDIAILDIQLDDDNGISLAKQLFPSHSGTAVIFITGYVEYCTDVYETNHVYFLLKPLKTIQLHKALNKATLQLHSSSIMFPIQIGSQLHRIDLENVCAIESFYRKLRIHLVTETIETYSSISLLPDTVYKRMIHCHKSFLVNPKYINSMSGEYFVMRNGEKIPISHSRRTQSRIQFLNYLASQMEG